MINLSYSKWLSIPLYLRAKIAHEFGIAKVRSTHVSDNQVVDDGYNLHDIENTLTKERLETFLNTKSDDMNVLMDLLVDWADGRYQPTVEVVEPTLETPEPVITTLSIEEVTQFNSEYEERTGLEAPKHEVTKPKNAKRKKSK